MLEVELEQWKEAWETRTIDRSVKSKDKVHESDWKAIRKCQNTICQANIT